MKPPTLTDQERFDRLRLSRTEQVGTANFRRLLQRYGSAGKALKHLPELAKSGGRSKPLTPPPVAAIEAELADAAKLGALYLHLGEACYPEPLAAIDSTPVPVAPSTS